MDWRDNGAAIAASMQQGRGSGMSHICRTVDLYFECLRPAAL